MNSGDQTPVDEEVEMICKQYPPIPPAKPELFEEEEILTEDYPIPDQLRIPVIPQCAWSEEGRSLEVPPPLPPKPHFIELIDDGGANEESLDYTPEDSMFLSPDNYRTNSTEYEDSESPFYDDHVPSERTGERLKMNNKTESGEYLDDNLRHLQGISANIQCIRRKDIARLKQSSPTEVGRLSNSCPNLGQDESFLSTETEYEDEFDPVSQHRVIPGVAITNFDAEFAGRIGPYNSSENLYHAQPHTRSPLYVASIDSAMIQHLDDVEPEVEDEQSLVEEEQEEEEHSSSASRRPHSWHSTEKLNIVPEAEPVVVHSHKRSRSYQGDSPLIELEPEIDEEENLQGHDTVVSPSVRRVRQKGRHSNSTFAVVGSEKEDMKRSMSLSSNNNNNAVNDPGERRYTISEGVITNAQRNSLLALQELIKKHDEITKRIAASSDEVDSASKGGQDQMSLTEFLLDPSNFENEEEEHPKPLPHITTGYAAKPFVPPRLDGGIGAKKTVSRKLSFLTKMRNSTRTKTANSKDRPKKIAEFKVNSALKSNDGKNDDNLTESKDKESLRDLPWNTVKKGKKGNNPNTQRPQSMMISKLPTTYGPSSVTSSNGSYFATNINHRIHGLPVPSSRPMSTYEYGKTIESNIIDGKNQKNSYKDEDSTSLHSGTRTPPHSSPYNHGMSESVESLYEGEVSLDLSELEKDPDLKLKEDEPEAWSVTVEKRMLKKMNKKDIKRQDNIFEFIQKERNFLTTLKIMQRIFAHGMSRELQTDQDTIEKMFPQIDELVDFTTVLVQQLNDRQHKSQIVHQIGDILVEQWSGDNGVRMLWLFSEFCSKQKDIVAMYKDMLKNDKKFQEFTTKCAKNPMTRRRDIPACILLVTQRITKYPVILKTLIENSSKKEHKTDSGNLEEALEMITDIIKKVDKQVLEYEKQQKLKDVYQKMDVKSYATFKDGRKFNREDLLNSSRTLVEHGTLQWKANNKKPVDVTLLLLTDCLLFLQENNQRYSFPSLGQPAIVPLHKLIVREKAGEDNVLFLISASNYQAEMYELIFQSQSDSKLWMQAIRKATDNCPEEDEGVSHEDVEEQKVLEQKWEKAHQLIGDLELKDRKVTKILEEKMQTFKELSKLLERQEATGNVQFRYPVHSFPDHDNRSKIKLPLGTPVLLKAIEQVNKLSYAMCGPGGLSRNPSSVGEHESGTILAPSLPKRSETFSGFDNGKEPPSPRGKWPMGMSKSSSKPDSVASSDESKRDSGLIEGEISIHGSEGYIGGDMSANSSPMGTVGHGMLLPPTTDQVSALAQLTHLLNEYRSTAAQQDTQIEKMYFEMTKALDKSLNRRRMGSNIQEAEAKRNHLKQHELEQELLRKQNQLKTQQDTWEKHSKRFQVAQEKETKQLQEELEKLNREKLELQQQQEEVRRNKEESQKMMARLRDLQRKAEKDGIHHSSSFPSSLANKNNNNSVDEPDCDEDLTIKSSRTISGSQVPNSLANMPGSVSKSHSSLEAEILEAQVDISSTYTNVGDYPRTYPGGGKRDQAPFPNHSANSSAPSTQMVPLHLHSATNQVSGHAAPLRHNNIPHQLLSSTKSHHRTSQVISSKLSKLSLSNNSSQSSNKTALEGIKSKLPFTHKKNPRNTSSSSDLVDGSGKGSQHPFPLKHSKSDVNLDNNRNRAISSPSPFTLTPDSALERSNSASSNSSKEGDKKKKNKRSSWGSNSDKQNEKEIYF